MKKLIKGGSKLQGRQKNEGEKRKRNYNGNEGAKASHTFTLEVNARARHRYKGMTCVKPHRKLKVLIGAHKPIQSGEKKVIFSRKQMSKKMICSISDEYSRHQWGGQFLSKRGRHGASIVESRVKQRDTKPAQTSKKSQEGKRKKEQVK